MLQFIFSNKILDSPRDKHADGSLFLISINQLIVVLLGINSQRPQAVVTDVGGVLLVQFLDFFVELFVLRFLFHKRFLRLGNSSVLYRKSRLGFTWGYTLILGHSCWICFLFPVPVPLLLWFTFCCREIRLRLLGFFVLGTGFRLPLLLGFFLIGGLRIFFLLLFLVAFRAARDGI